VSGTIVAIGDVLRQLISNRSQEGSYQRTLITDAAEATYGGAAWNVVWNLEQLGWTTRMLAHYGADAVGRLPQLPVSGRDALEPFCQKLAQTDQLLVFPKINMPAVYLRGRLSQDELHAMFASIGRCEAIVFAGSRHSELRRSILETQFVQSGRLRVFSPSYTIYEYGADELAAFLAHSDIAIVNRHEAAFLGGVLGEASVMARVLIAGIITRDEDGADVYPAGQPSFHLPSASQVPGDCIGAGDAFLSGFVDEYLRSRDVTAAARVAIEVSAQTARSGIVCASLDAMRARTAAKPPSKVSHR